MFGIRARTRHTGHRRASRAFLMSTPTKSMVLLLASLHSAGALVLHHRHHAPGRVVELGTRAGHAVMQHSKGWDDFGKPPFNFYKVSPTCVASLPWLALLQS